MLDAAIDWVRHCGGKLVLFRAMGIPPELPEAALHMKPAALCGLLEQEAAQYLERCAARVPPALLAGTRVDIGAPAHSLCGRALQERATLVVIGSHGYGGIDRLLGTTASKIVNHAHCSVLVVRAAE